MVSLVGEHIYLRALEPEDLEVVYTIENNTDFWELSDAQTPYSRFLIKQYLENAKQDIFEAKQLRLAICNRTDNSVIGLIDIFDVNIKNNRAGIGIIITNKADRNRGYGSEALSLLVHYCFKTLHLHQVYASIGLNNKASLKIFQGLGFEIVGLKKDWRFDGKSYYDEYLLQKIREY